MSKLKFEAIESFVSELEEVFNECGLQNKNGTDDKYFYFRSSIPSEHINDKIVLRYVFTQDISESADNTWHSMDVYINATVFINSAEGYDDVEYLGLMKQLEEKCVDYKISMDINIDSTEYIVGDATTETKCKQIEFSKIVKRR